MTEVFEVATDLSEVGRLNEALSERWARLNLPEDHEFPATLAVEEILSNVIRHSDAHKITVIFDFQPGAFAFDVIDDGPAFNPLEVAPLDPESPLEARRAGGMGLHIVRNLATELRYEHRDGCNRLTFRRQWETGAHC